MCSTSSVQERDNQMRVIVDQAHPLMDSFIGPDIG